MILVTGATGLLGSHLLYYLTLSNNKVRALTRTKKNIDQVKKVFGYYTTESEKLFQQIEWVEGDLLNKSTVFEILDEIEEVYHCAALISFNSSDSKKIIFNNTTSTENLINACLEKNIKKFCHVSSIAAIDGTEDEQQTNEQTNIKHLKGKSGYAISKFKSELEVWRGITEGLNAVIVNPSVIIGPGNWNNGSCQLFPTINKGLKFYTKGVTGYIDVNDVCKIMIQLMRQNIFGERFILNAENLSYKNTFSLISKKLNKKPPQIKVNKPIALLGYRLAGIFSFITRTNPRITKDSVKAAFNKQYYSNKKITDLLDYTFNSIENSIAFTAKCYLKS